MEERADDLMLPDDSGILTRQQEKEIRIPLPEETEGDGWERILSGNKVIFKPKRGGARSGAGRNPKGHPRHP
jgi:hypothetical protein